MTDRYRTQELLPQWTPAGQRRLRDARVLIVGVGGLGGYHAELLARAGVGFLRLVDRDRPDLANLHRQVLYTEDDLAAGRPKVDLAADRLARVNREVAVEAVFADVAAANIDGLCDGIDLVVDATDNFAARDAINAACVRRSLPWIYGGVVGTTGVVLPIQPARGPCLRCLFPALPDDDALPRARTVGIINTGPAFVAAIQVTLAYRLLLGDPPPADRLLEIDLWELTFAELTINRQPRCPVCGASSSERDNTAILY